MTGREQIIALRRRGVKPVVVWVSDYRTNDAGNGRSVSLAPEDSPARIDWRFLVGLTVVVDGDDAERVDSIARAVGQFAERVLTTVYSDAKNIIGEPVKKVSRLTDTKGIMQWQAS